MSRIGDVRDHLCCFISSDEALHITERRSSEALINHDFLVNDLVETKMTEVPTRCLS